MSHGNHGQLGLLREDVYLEIIKIEAANRPLGHTTPLDHGDIVTKT
jgi:hypothetical protein